jgi:hypothetical protein
MDHPIFKIAHQDLRQICLGANRPDRGTIARQSVIREYPPRSDASASDTLIQVLAVGIARERLAFMRFAEPAAAGIRWQGKHIGRDVARVHGTHIRRLWTWPRSARIAAIAEAIVRIIDTRLGDLAHIAGPFQGAIVVVKCVANALPQGN